MYLYLWNYDNLITIPRANLWGFDDGDRVSRQLRQRPITGYGNIPVLVLISPLPVVRRYRNHLTTLFPSWSWSKTTDLSLICRRCFSRCQRYLAYISYFGGLIDRIYFQLSVAVASVEIAKKNNWGEGGSCKPTCYVQHQWTNPPPPLLHWIIVTHGPTKCSETQQYFCLVRYLATFSI